MATDDMTFKGSPLVFDHIADLLGKMSPFTYSKIIGENQPSTPSPAINGLSNPLRSALFGEVPPPTDAIQPKTSSYLGSQFGPAYSGNIKPMFGGMAAADTVKPTTSSYLGSQFGPAYTGPATTPTPTEPPHRSVFGKIGEDIKHGLGKVGRGIGDVLIPDQMKFIPGTEQHMVREQMIDERRQKALDEERQMRALAGIEEEKLREQPELFSTTKAGSEAQAAARTETARAAEERAEAAKIRAENLPALSKAGYKYEVTPDGVETGRIVPMTEDELSHVATTKPPVEKPPETKTLVGPDGKNHDYAWNAKTGKFDLDMGVAPPSFAQTGFYDPTEVNVGGKLLPGKFDRRTGSVTTANTTGVVAIPKGVEGDLNKIMDTARGADTRYGVMIDNQAPALAGNQQAMINILANHLGMTQGLQKGSRINQAMWDEATASAPWIDRVLSRFTKTDANGDRVITGPLTGITLTPEQIKQMVELGQDRRIREWQQVMHTAQQNGLDISGEIPQDVRQGIAEAEGAAGNQTNRKGAPQVGSDAHFNEWQKNRNK